MALLFLFVHRLGIGRSSALVETAGPQAVEAELVRARRGHVGA